MFGTYFYNKNIRNIVILFGTVFNDISVRRVDNANVVQEEFKVPIAYGPSEKYLVRLRQATEVSKGKVGITLPRMSFEFTSIAYDPARKLQTTKRHKAIKSLGTVEGITLVSGGNGYTSAPQVLFSGGGATTQATATATVVDGSITIALDTGGVGYTSTPTINITGGGGANAIALANLEVNTSVFASVYNPVPYNFDFTLSVMVKNSDDGTQILEQILPYFTPEYHVTMNEMSALGIKRDIPIIFTGLSTEDSYEGDFMTRRALIHTLSFVVQGFLYGPTSDMGIIRTVDVNKYNTTASTTKISNTQVTPDPVTADLDDDYGYTTTLTE